MGSNKIKELIREEKVEKRKVRKEINIEMFIVV